MESVSSLVECALMGGIYALAGLPFFYSIVETNRRGDEIASGVVKGVAVSVEHRWLMLVHTYLALNMAGILFLGALALIMFRLAESAASASAESLGYALAVVAGFGAASWPILTASYVVFCVRLLRAAKTGAG